MHYRSFLCALLPVAVPLRAFCQTTIQPVRDHSLDLSPYQLQVIYENDFSKQDKVVREEDLIERTAQGAWKRKAKPAADADWIAEGRGACVIRDGKLWVAPSEFDADGHPKVVPTDQRSHMVVWSQRAFPADFLLELEMTPCGSTNGLTIVFFCATGKNGEDIFDLSLPPRRADYKMYHSDAIANHTDSYWSRNTEVESISNRLRKNPGFNEVAAGSSRTTGDSTVTHYLRILKIGGHIEVEINHRVVVQWDDPGEALGAGRIGLRSMSGVTSIAYDNFKVSAVKRK